MEKVDKDDKIKISFTINGEKKEMEVKSNQTLLTFIRDDLGLIGTKYGCGEGSCGVCTILMNGNPAKSCQYNVSAIDGKNIITIEGLSGEDDDLHPIQKAFAETGAVQCGYCIPGLILRTKWLLEKNSSPTREKAKRAISPILCRCTGYRKIIDAVMLASEKMEVD